jgi:hypothetical protein
VKIGFALVLAGTVDRIILMKVTAVHAPKTPAINHGPGYPFDLTEDSPALETELLKGVKGPFTSYSRKEMKAIGERIIREKRRS